MADLPRILARPDLPYKQLPRTNAAAYGAQAFGEAAQQTAILSRIDAAAAEAEAQKAVAVTRERIKQSSQQAEDEYQDPTEYQSFAAGQAEAIYQGALKEIKNDKAKALFTDRMAPFVVAAQSDVQHTYRHKLVNKTKADSMGYLETAERELSQATRPLDIQNKEAEIVMHVQDMQRLNALTPIEGQKIIQGIKERDSLRRAQRELSISMDPAKTIVEIQKKYPNIDPDKVLALEDRAQTRQREIERQQEKIEKQVHDENVLMDTIDAVNGRMTQIDLDARAKARRYTREDYSAVRRAMEEGGVTNPQIYTDIERQIREGRWTDYGAIAANPNLDRQAKSTLMGLIQQAKDDKHFSKTPEYQEAKQELRVAVSPKGQFESLDKTEQARYLQGLRELWDRAGRGESPMAITRDLQERIAREPTQGEKPLFLPRFQSEQDLVNAYRNRQIDRQTFDTQARLLKEWQVYNKKEADRAAQPKTESSRRR